MKNRIQKTGSQRGAALLVILALFSVIIPIVQGVYLDSQIEYQFRRYRMNELQARQNARSGIGFSLLRLYIFKGLEGSLSGSGQWDSVLRPLLDRIWSFPFVWPLPVSDNLLESDKQTLKSLQDQSFFRGAYGVSIAPEGGLLDVNELSSPLLPLRKFTFDSLLRLLILSREGNEELKDKYQASDFVALLNNLSDWTDPDKESQNGGSEELLEEGKKPLNRSFASVEEIMKTPGMTVEIFELLKPHITVYGSKSLNINYAGKEVLQAVLNISPELADQILSRTQIQSEYYDPFLNRQTFCSFVDQLDVCGAFESAYSLELLRFGYPMAFRIKSSGEYRGRIVNLEALLYDLSSSALNWQKSLYQERQRQEREQDEALARIENNENTEASPPSAPKQPKMDYSYYKSLTIMYLKEGS